MSRFLWHLHLTDKNLSQCFYPCSGCWEPQTERKRVHFPAALFIIKASLSRAVENSQRFFFSPIHLAEALCPSLMMVEKTLLKQMYKALNISSFNLEKNVDFGLWNWLNSNEWMLSNGKKKKFVIEASGHISDGVLITQTICSVNHFLCGVTDWMGVQPVRTQRSPVS